MKIFSKILIILTILGLFICLWMAVNRVRIESDFKEIDLAIDYDGVRSLARRYGLNPQRLLKRFKAEGITSVIIREDTLSSLQEEGRLFIFSSNQLRERAQLDLFTGYSLHPKLRKTLLSRNKSYILTNEDSLWNHLRKTLKFKIPGYIKEGKEGDLRVIEIDGMGESLHETGVGFFKKRLKELSELELNIILFPSNFGQPNVRAINHLFEAAEIWGVRKAIFEEEALGYPKNLLTTLSNLKNRGLSLLLLEFSHPKGIEVLSSQMPDYSVRTHRISEEEMEKIDKETATLRFLRAARERNIRCLYLLPFLGGEENLINMNLDYVRELKNRLRLDGFRIGVKNTIPKIEINSLLLLLVSLGVISSILLFVNRIVPLSFRWHLVIFTLSAVISLYGLLNRTFLQQFWTTTSAITFPTLAMLTLKQGLGEKPFLSTLGWCIKNTLMVSGISLLGALFIIGLLSEGEYLLKISEVRGIKITMLLPILSVGMFSYLRDHGVDQLVLKPIRAIHLVELGILVGLLILLLARSGNYEFPALPIEEEVRLILERLLFARPRFKEFLIGYPALLLAIFLLGQGYRSIFFLTLATISQVSLVNTYLHPHTPLLFQLLRSINGLWLGILIGIVPITAWWWLTQTTEVVET